MKPIGAARPIVVTVARAETARVYGPQATHAAFAVSRNESSQRLSIGVRMPDRRTRNRCPLTDGFEPPAPSVPSCKFVVARPGSPRPRSDSQIILRHLSPPAHRSWASWTWLAFGTLLHGRLMTCTAGGSQKPSESAYPRRCSIRRNSGVRPGPENAWTIRGSHGPLESKAAAERPRPESGCTRGRA